MNQPTSQTRWQSPPAASAACPWQARLGEQLAAAGRGDPSAAGPLYDALNPTVWPVALGRADGDAVVAGQRVVAGFAALWEAAPRFRLGQNQRFAVGQVLPDVPVLGSVEASPKWHRSPGRLRPGWRLARQPGDLS